MRSGSQTEHTWFQYKPISNNKAGSSKQLSSKKVKQFAGFSKDQFLDLLFLIYINDLSKQHPVYMPVIPKLLPCFRTQSCYTVCNDLERAEPGYVCHTQCSNSYWIVNYWYIMQHDRIGFEHRIRTSLRLVSSCMLHYCIFIGFYPSNAFYGKKMLKWQFRLYSGQQTV